jgi:EKC/KEOPS complex subunit CGI121/TPRKB
MTDLARVKKAYKLNSGGGPKSGKATLDAVQEAAGDDLKEIEVTVLGAMALRGAS